ncbi:MAG: hypothetical protein KA436_01405 [Oligoflexales bacterium]|nr:hypothetical protein [Oligoflexales bacterium]
MQLDRLLFVLDSFFLFSGEPAAPSGTEVSPAPSLLGAFRGLMGTSCPSGTEVSPNPSLLGAFRGLMGTSCPSGTEVSPAPSLLGAFRGLMGTSCPSGTEVSPNPSLLGDFRGVRILLTTIVSFLVLSLAGFAMGAPASDPTLNLDKWIAAGSGCSEYKEDKEGHFQGIRLASRELDAANPMIHKFTFSMDSYMLLGNSPIHKNRASFARECSIRLALRPSPGYRIKDLTMQTELSLHKSKGVSAELHSRLMTGTGILAQWGKIYPEKENILSRKLPLLLSTDEKGKQILSQEACGSEKLVGADLSFLNRRKSFKNRVEVQHSGAKELLISVEMETCPKL